MSAEAGVSSLGIRLGYGVSTRNAVPTAFEWLERVNSIGGVALSTEQIDASALEDMISRYIQGRQDTGGTWEITFNLSNDVVTQLDGLIEEYQGMGDGEVMWFEVWSPYMKQAFMIIAQVPANIPMPESGQNSLWTVALSLTIEEYKGLMEGVKPVHADGSGEEEGA